MVPNTTIQTLFAWTPLLLQGASVTIQLALYATGIGLVLGIGMGIISCRKIAIPVLKQCCKLYVSLIQGTPLFVQLLLLYYALPELLGFNVSSFTAGVITLGLNSAAYVAEIVRGGINAIPPGQWEAAFSLGYSLPTTLKAIILPQAIKVVFPALTNELVVLIKETAVISVIGVLELTKVGINLNAQALDPLAVYGAVALLYLGMTTTVGLCSQYFEKKGTSHDYY